MQPSSSWSKVVRIWFMAYDVLGANAFRSPMLWLMMWHGALVWAGSKNPLDLFFGGVVIAHAVFSELARAL